MFVFFGDLPNSFQNQITVPLLAGTNPPPVSAVTQLDSEQELTFLSTAKGRIQQLLGKWTSSAAVHMFLTYLPLMLCVCVCVRVSRFLGHRQIFAS